MTFTLDGKSLTVLSFGEDLEAVDFQWDTFESEAYKREIHVYGKVKTWTLECLETDVTWTNSAAKHLQTKLITGDAVTFVVAEGDLHAVSVSVKVLGVDIVYEEIADKNIRHFSLQLQEV